MVRKSGNKGVCVPHMHHHRAERVLIGAYYFFGPVQSRSFPLPHLTILPYISCFTGRGSGVDYFNTVEGHPEFFYQGLYAGLVAEEYRPGYLVVYQLLGGAQYLFFLPFREHDPLGAALRFAYDGAHHFTGAAEALFKLKPVFCNIHRLLGDAGFHSGFGDGGGFPDEHPGIEGLGDYVFPAELQLLSSVSFSDGIRNVLLSQLGQRVGGGQLHFVVYLRGPDIQCASEDEREAQHIIDLVGVVRAAGGHK